jgi:hypothetical protein
MTVQDVVVVAILLAIAAAIDRFLIPAPFKGWFWAFVAVCLIFAALRVFGLLGTRVL